MKWGGTGVAHAYCVGERSERASVSSAEGAWRRFPACSGRRLEGPGGGRRSARGLRPGLKVVAQLPASSSPGSPTHIAWVREANGLQSPRPRAPGGVFPRKPLDRYARARRTVAPFPRLRRPDSEAIRSTREAIRARAKLSGPPAGEDQAGAFAFPNKILTIVLIRLIFCYHRGQVVMKFDFPMGWL